MRILIIRFSSLGDVVLAATAIRAFAQQQPQAEITLATKSVYAPLFDHDRIVREIVTYDPTRSWTEYLDQWKNRSFDRVVDLHDLRRSRSLCRRVDGAEISRVRKHTLRRQAMVWFKRGLGRPLSTYNNYLEALSVADDGNAAPDISLDLSDGEQERVEALRQESPRTLGIGWGARHPTKAVPVYLWRELIAKLAGQTPLTSAQLFGLNLDHAAIESFINEQRLAVPQVALTAHCGLSLREAMVHLAACSAFVSSDSGLMHLAAALGVPTIGLFGPTHPSLGFAPVGRSTAAFHARTWCSPCHRHGRAPCFRDHRHCFAELNVDQIAAAILPHLNEIRSRST